MSSNDASTILVVDDTAATRYATSRILRAAGFQVLEADCGTVALELAARRPDLVVLDVNLPDIDGFEVCRRLRAMPETARIPVVHLSATFVNDADKVQGFEAGADGYITHPFEPPVLVATVQAFLRARQAEELLRRSEAKFKAVFEQALSGMALLTDDLIFLEINPAMCATLGRRCTDVAGRYLGMFTPDDREIVVDELKAALAHTGAWRGVIPVLGGAGRRVELEWNVSRHSEPGVSLAVTTDITDRLEFESERERLLESEQASRADAERANRLKDDFLAMLSHELRTPLNAIVGWATVLKERSDLTDPDFVRGIQAIERNARVQTQLISDLLDVSRITSGKLTLESEWFDPISAVDNALSSVRPLADAKSITLEVEATVDTAPFFWDSSRFQQVVWNLADNGVKFTPAGGRVVVRLADEGGSLELSVQDTGRGISAEFLPHAFERFRQQDSMTSRDHGGLGLGLAIVKHLVEALGGSVAATSDGQDRGSTFRASLPRIADASHADEPAVRREEPASAHLRGVRALVVEDDADARGLIVRTLVDAGAAVCDAGDTTSALGMLARFSPDVVVSDIGMPRDDGYEFIRRVRELGYDAETTPAIALTAFAREEDRARALKAGYQIHLSKPVYPSRLVDVTARLVEQSRRARQVL